MTTIEDFDLQSVMIIFELLLTTFEASIIFKAGVGIAKCGFSKNQTNITKLNQIKLEQIERFKSIIICGL